MKKGWKIALISLGSLLGLVIVVVVVACWLIFTPSRLTAIVNKMAGDYITCENHFAKVDLTLFKTYPNVGLDIEDVLLINPYQLPDSNVLAAKTVHNDTLAHIGSLTVGIDLKAFLKDRSIIVRQLRIDDAKANLYTAPDGWSNLSIFKPTQEDTTKQEESSSGLPETIQLEKLSVNNLAAQYCNLQQNMLAQVYNLDLNLKGSLVDSQMDADLSMDVDSLLVDLLDSVGAEKIYANLSRLSLGLDGAGTTDNIGGHLKLSVPKGDFVMSGTHYTTEAMQQSRKDLLALSIPFHANLDDMSFSLGEKSRLSLTDYDLSLWGDVALAHEDAPMQVDVHYAIDQWQVADLLSILPPFITRSLKGMDVDAKASIHGSAKGVVAEGRLPLIDAEVTLQKGSFAAPKMLPMPVKNIQAQLSANLNLSTDSAFKGPSNVQITQFSAKLQKTELDVQGTVQDLLGDMLVDANIKGNLNLPDLRAFLPDTMPITLKGRSKADLKVKSRLSSLQKLDLKKITANGTLKFTQLDVIYDSIHALSPKLDVALRLPTKKTSTKVSELLGAHITGGVLDVEMANNGLTAKVEDPDIQVGMPNILDKRQPLAAAFNIRFSRVDAKMDSMLVYSDTLKLKGSIKNDSKQDNVIKQWNPDLDIDIHRGVLTLANMSDPLRLTDFEFNYKPEVVNIARADLLWGVSDYHLRGKVYGLENWISHTQMLTGDIYFNSTYADIDQLMNILSGMGSEADTLAKQRVEDNVPKEANPFIVPKDVRVKLNTHIHRCVAFGNDLNDLSGSVTLNDGTAILEQVGFTCKAARMELTGVYRSPRVNNLFVGLDFHLLDIQIEELLDMIPSIDTLVPMLAAFEGKANFHLAAECNLDAYYKPKMSTLLGAAAISGNDLVVIDNATVAQMAKLLQFKNWREKDNNIGVDSISVEAQVFRKEITVLPFLLNLHNYQLCIAGSHNLSGNCNYHLELLKCPLPARIAVDVRGNIAKPNIALGKIQYAELYNPEKQNQLQARTLEIKRLVRQALEANVRKQ